MAALILFAASACTSAPLAQVAESPEPTPTTSEPSVTPTAHTPRPKGCATVPSRCGYPDATNTGVPAGIQLRPSESLTLSQPGQVVDGLEVRGEINVEADNVTIKNTRVIGGRGAGNPDWVVVVRPGVTRLTIVDSELTTPPNTPQDIACLLNIGNAVPVLDRVDIHGCSAGVSSGGGRITNSYIHDMSEIKGLTHAVGVASNGGGGMTVRHNTILNQISQTAAVALYQDFGPQHDDLIEDNLLAGGSYCLYGGAGEKGATSQIRLINNRLSTIYAPKCGHFGVLASFTATDSGNRFHGNYWDETGRDVHE